MNFKTLGLSNTKKMLADALKRGYAVPAYNFDNLQQLQAILSACAETKSPVILSVSASALKFIGPETLMGIVAGEISQLSTLNSQLCKAVALHLDHGADFEMCKACIDMGFSSVMIDGSALAFDKNVALTKKVAEYARKRDVSVEAELGSLRGAEDGAKHAAEYYTNPDDAVRFVKATGIDSLAVSVGTSHGVYKLPPRSKAGIRFDILKETARRLPGFPLVLHGASSVPPELIKEINKYGGKIKQARGIPEEQIVKARKMNICKINVNSDARLAFTAGVRRVLAENPSEYEPKAYLSAARDMMKKLYTDKNKKLMGSAGKA